MQIILFEDAQVVELYPVTVGRAAFTISCGSFRLVDQILSLGFPVQARVRGHLRDLLAADFPQLSGRKIEQSTGQVLAVNARLVPSVAALRQLQGLLDAGQPGIVRHGTNIVAALVSARDFQAESTDEMALPKFLDGLALPALEATLPLLEYPHDIVRYHLTTMNDNLAARLAGGGYREVADGVMAAEGATLAQYVVTDTRRGPVVIEAGASIGAYCYLSGPAHVGAGARVIEHSAIKDCVSLGHTSKIGGEVEASIIEAYTNKQHHGFLGHSYLGNWINLGAGTCNSDLKNTYGQVNMQYRNKKVATGMQFVGVIMGDYAKTAINTGIFTGKTVGVCSMMYGFVTTNVPSFVNYARLFGQITATPVEVMVAAQARMFARRNVAQRPCDIQMLSDMYELTRHERELGSVPFEPLSL